VLASATGTTSRLGGATVAAGGQVLDHHTYLEHAAPGCASRQLYKTVLAGGGHAVFSGRILVRPVAQQTDAFQLNQNLLLGDARVDTKPQLEIGADDVRCTHGATTGRLNDDQLFYLQARAIPRAAAVRMLARGFLDEVAGDLPDEAVCPRLLNLLHRRLDRLAEDGAGGTR
jgi:Fe-S cluster assembly protein SufD